MSSPHQRSGVRDTSVRSRASVSNAASTACHHAEAVEAGSPREDAHPSKTVANSLLHEATREVCHRHPSCPRRYVKLDIESRSRAGGTAETRSHRIGESAPRSFEGVRLRDKRDLAGRTLKVGRDPPYLPPKRPPSRLPPSLARSSVISPSPSESRRLPMRSTAPGAFF